MAAALALGAMAGLAISVRLADGDEAPPLTANRQTTLVPIDDPAEIAAKAGFRPLLPANLPARYRVSDQVQVVTQEGIAGETWVTVNFVVKGPSQPMGGAIFTQSNQKRTPGGNPSYVKQETVGPYEVTVYGPPPGRDDTLIVQFEHQGVFVDATANFGPDFKEEDLRAVIASLAR